MGLDLNRTAGEHRCVSIEIIVHHGVIHDDTRFLVVENYRNDWWLAWENGIKPLNLGTLLKEEHFRRE